jgi:DNA ligase D-like protein (predicted polymerase)
MSATASDEPVVAGIRLSHPDRLIYPDLELSKVQLARYYENIEEWILPHIRGRPLTLIHCPAGIGGPCAFMRHGKAWGPSALRRVRIPEKTKVGEYLVADSISAVVALAQMGVVEIHTWNSTTDDIERPNRIVWDLDPGPEVAWKHTVATARLLRDVLKTLSLASWVKTTGGRGLHVVVPIEPSLDWSALPRVFARCERILRTQQSVALHDGVQQAGTRSQDPDRLPQKQPDEHVGVRVLAARAGGCSGVASVGLAGVEGGRRAMDAAHRSATSSSPARRSVGRLLESRAADLEEVTRRRQTALSEQ